MDRKQAKAFRLAKQRIAEAIDLGAEELSLSGEDFDSLTLIPHEIADIRKLAELDLQDTEVSDLTPLAGLTALEWLNIDNAPVIDLTPLASVTGLQKLFLENTLVVDVTPLANATGLQMLYLNKTQVSDLTPLAKVTELQALYLNDTTVTDLTPLAQIKGLEVLYLNNTQVTDLTPLAQVTGLRTLYLNSTPVWDLTPLAQVVGLRELYLSSTQVTDLTPLSQVTALQMLYLNNTRVKDLTPLAKVAGLQMLYINNTQVLNLQPLAEIAELRMLDLTASGVTDLTPLIALHKLWRLSFEDIPACAADPRLKDLAAINNTPERTRETLAYLRGLVAERAREDDDARDFFISFNKAQRAHADAIYARLVGAGFSVHFYPQDLAPTGNFIAWMNQALASSRRVLCLCATEYFEDDAEFSKAERDTVMALDPNGAQNMLWLAELATCAYPPLYRRFGRIAETSGLAPEDAADALLAVLQSRGLKGGTARWRAMADQVVLDAPDLDAEGLEDAAEALETARNAAEALAQKLTDDEMPQDDLAAAAAECVTHLKRDPKRLRTPAVSTLYLRLRDQLLLRAGPPGSGNNVVLSDGARGRLQTVFAALRSLLLALPGGAEEEKRLLESDAEAETAAAAAVVDAMDGDARVDADSVAIAKILVRLAGHKTQAARAAGETLNDLVNNFEVAIGDIVQRLHTARTEGGPDEMQAHFIVGFIHQHRGVLRAFAVAHVPSGAIWWDTIMALVDPNR